MLALAAKARLLDPAEGRDLGRDDAGVDADDAVFQRLGHPPDPAEIAGVEIGGEAEDGVVGHGRSPRPRLELEQRRDRAEGLLSAHLHVAGHAAITVG
jgi:hypothetical protein